MTTYKLVEEFHRTFGHIVEDKPTIPSKKLIEARLDWLREEIDELSEALHCGDLVSTLDALSDIQYILDGTYLVCGMQKVKQVAFEEVHRSNMSKLGVDGKPILSSTGKILKGPNYFKPNLTQFI